MEARRFRLGWVLVLVTWDVASRYRKTCIPERSCVKSNREKQDGGSPYTTSQLRYPQHQILHLCWRNVLVAKKNHTPLGDWKDKETLGQPCSGNTLRHRVALGEAHS